MDSLKKGLNIFQNIMFVLAIVVFICILLPRLFGIVPYVVKTGSMEPTIKTGSVAFINTKADVKSLKKDDVIAFKLSEDLLVTHRIYEVCPEYFVTKGDANDDPDAKWVYHSNVIGKNVFSISGLGKVVLALQGTKAKVLIGLFIVLNIAISIFLGYDSKKNQKNIERT